MGQPGMKAIEPNRSASLPSKDQATLTVYIPSQVQDFSFELCLQRYKCEPAAKARFANSTNNSAPKKAQAGRSQLSHIVITSYNIHLPVQIQVEIR